MSESIELCKIPIYSNGTKFNEEELNARVLSAIQHTKVLIPELANLLDAELMYSMETQSDSLMLVIAIIEASQLSLPFRGAAKLDAFESRKKLLAVRSRIYQRIKELPLIMNFIALDGVAESMSADASALIREHDDKDIPLKKIMQRRQKSTQTIQVDDQNTTFTFPEMISSVIDHNTRMISCRVYCVKRFLVEMKSVQDMTANERILSSRKLKLNFISQSADVEVPRILVDAMVKNLRISLMVKAILDPISRNVKEYEFVQFINLY